MRRAIWDTDEIFRQEGVVMSYHQITPEERYTLATLRKQTPALTQTEQRGLFKTITVDNGTEFHGYDQIERATGVTFYFATPYHSWERGTNENTNGLIRQYLPKRSSMQDLTQSQCSTIACILNNRPRKRYSFRSPLEELQRLARPRR